VRSSRIPPGHMLLHLVLHVCSEEQLQPLYRQSIGCEAELPDVHVHIG
jgi:hypothetical protein